MPEEIKTEVESEVVETVEEEPEVFEDSDLPYDPDEADEDWDNVKWTEGDKDDNGGEEESDDSNPAEADQPEAGQAVENQAETEAAKPEAAEQDADQWLELRHMDDPVRKVSKDEARELAQKGLDYDRIRQERDTLKANSARYAEMENFLKEMQGDFASIEDFMDDTRARVKAEQEGIPFDDAMRAVKEARTPKETPVQQPQYSPVDLFLMKYPTVKSEDIPASVWEEVGRTGDLLGAYERYKADETANRIKQLEQEIATLKNNNKNAARSAGSSKTSGGAQTKSLIASLWDNDD